VIHAIISTHNSSTSSRQRRIAFEDGLEESTTGMTEVELEESIRRKEALSRAIVLEMTGDLPDVYPQL
jgi:hypothetical protein